MQKDKKKCYPLLFLVDDSDTDHGDGCEFFVIVDRKVQKEIKPKKTFQNE